MLNEHWQEVYSSKKADEVSWYQRKPEVSLRLVTSHAASSDAVIDVGAGQSCLVDALLDDGFIDVTVMDISEVAVSEVRQRVHGRVSASFVVADVCTWAPTRNFDLWHDRAVFHFMKSAEEKHKAHTYDLIKEVVSPSGKVVTIVEKFSGDSGDL
jgi:trans-aconitate methyltransferase